MTTKQGFGARLIESMQEAVAIERGAATPARRHTVTAREATVAKAPEYTAPDVTRVRERLGVSQVVFAKALNVSPATVRSWEQGKRIPDGPSKRLLEIAERTPDAVMDGVVIEVKAGHSSKLGRYLHNKRSGLGKGRVLSRDPSPPRDRAGIKQSSSRGGDRSTARNKNSRARASK